MYPELHDDLREHRDWLYLVYFAGFRKHVSVYPAPIGNAEFAEEMAIYGSGRGTAKFPLDRPIPHDLITRMVKWRIRETLARVEAKTKKAGPRDAP